MNFSASIHKALKNLWLYGYVIVFWAIEYNFGNPIQGPING